MDYKRNNRDKEGYDQGNEIYSQRVKAGKRTYMFDVRATRGNDYYVTITERKRDPNGDGVYKQKIFLYKEDFNKFIGALEDVINHVKTELLPDYDYDQYDRDKEDWSEESATWGSTTYKEAAE